MCVRHTLGVRHYNVPTGLFDLCMPSSDHSGFPGVNRHLTAGWAGKSFSWEFEA